MKKAYNKGVSIKCDHGYSSALLTKKVEKNKKSMPFNQSFFYKGDKSPKNVQSDDDFSSSMLSDDIEVKSDESCSSHDIGRG